LSAAIPAITIQFDLETESHTLYATSYGQTTPAGPRLFRAPPHPDIQFSHETQAQAEAAATKLRAYIEATWGKQPSKAKARKEGA
jgi:hypothetical protein